MMLDEKRMLLDLLVRDTTWCQHVEARDSHANQVHWDDETASAWDITGAVYRLFGAKRAGALLTQLDRHIHGKRRAVAWPPRSLELDAMVALQTFNDRTETTFAIMRSHLESAPVWSAPRRSSESTLPLGSG